MGIYYQTQLDDQGRTRTIYSCASCHSHMFCSTNIKSDNFHGKYGKALLISSVVNVKEGSHATREMQTGVYKVCDIRCQQCDRYMGWKYINAPTLREQYKEQKYVMEVTELVHSSRGKKTRHSTALNVWY